MYLLDFYRLLTCKILIFLCFPNAYIIVYFSKTDILSICCFVWLNNHSLTNISSIATFFSLGLGEPIIDQVDKSGHCPHGDYSLVVKQKLTIRYV